MSARGTAIAIRPPEGVRQTWSPEITNPSGRLLLVVDGSRDAVFAALARWAMIEGEQA